ncbi:MAG: hypothetical protein IKB44_01785 [Clostridia bacterium]|nr:hypothetical protein [Clostridia bacterium]MBR2472665.1 hypothetical protein [Clostridia bacterium]
MDAGTFAELKETLNIAYQLCDNIEQSGCWPMSGQLKMSDLLKYELVAFCRQLAAADKDFSLDERGFITSLFGLQGALLADKVPENSGNVPLIITLSQQVAQFEAQNGVSHTNGVGVSTVLLMVFEMTGKAFIISGGNDSREIAVYNNYVKLMQDFVKSIS